MHNPSDEALQAVHDFIYGKDHEGKEREQCTVGGTLMHQHIDSRTCDWDVRQLALVLDAFAMKRVRKALEHPQSNIANMKSTPGLSPRADEAMKELLSRFQFFKLMKHINHSLTFVAYGNPPLNAAVECKDCHEAVTDIETLLIPVISALKKVEGYAVAQTGLPSV